MNANKIRFMLGVLLALLLATSPSFALSLNQAAEFKEISGAPLRIQVGSNGSIQVYHQNHPADGSTYGTADSGLFLALGSDVYGPNLPNTNPTSASITTNPLTLVSHEGPIGSGSISDPFKVVTSQTLAGSGATLGVVQTVSYINGNDYFRQDWAITNNGASETCFKAYHAADVYFAGSDTGAGYYNAASGSVGGYNAAQDWFMVFTPVTPVSHYQEGSYSTDIWATVQAAGDFKDTIVTESVDNGFGLQWNQCVQPGQTTTISDLWSFGENEESVIPPTPEPTAVPAPPPSLKCDSCGDVHINTPDGLVYDFQEFGDFLLSQSTDGSVVLQARQERWASYPERPVSVNTAVAMYVGGDKLEFYLKPETSFYVNDVLTDLPTDYVSLPAGGSISATGSSDFTILWPDGNTGARVILRHDSLDIGIARLGGSLTYEGVLGNLDGDRMNDIQVRGGELITPPASLEQLKLFGDSWRLSAEESLFDAPLTAADTAEAAGPLTINDLDAGEKEAAANTCETAGVTDPLALHNCTYDVAVTGDESFVESAKTFQEDTADIPDEEFVAAVPAQGLPVAIPSGVVLEIGQQYAVPDAPGTFRYFQFSAFPTATESGATLLLCPDLATAGLVGVGEILTEEQALAQGLVATNEPCTGASAADAETPEEPATTTETTEEPATTTETTEEPETEAAGGLLSSCGLGLMPFFMLLGMVGMVYRRPRRLLP